MSERFIEALEGRRFLSVAPAAHGAGSGHAVAAVKVAAKPKKPAYNLVGNYDGEFKYPKYGTGASLWAVVTQQANGVVTLHLGSYKRFDYPIKAIWNATSRKLAGAYKAKGEAVKFSGTLSKNGKLITGKFTEVYKGKTYVGTFWLGRVAYDPRPQSAR